MGFDVLYFPPIHPIGKINRKGRNNKVRAEKGDHGSPWAIGSDEGGHKAILSKLGNDQESFKRYESAIDYDNLNTKQRFLLKQPSFVIQLFHFTKRTLQGFGIHLSAFR